MCFGRCTWVPKYLPGISLCQTRLVFAGSKGGKSAVVPILLLLQFRVSGFCLIVVAFLPHSIEAAP